MKKPSGDRRPVPRQGAVRSAPRYAIAESDKGGVAEEVASWANSKEHVVSATNAARNFSDLISRVAYRGETYIVERGGKAMCALSPVNSRRYTGADLLVLLPTLARPAEEFLAAVEEIAATQPTLEKSEWER